MCGVVDCQSHVGRNQQYAIRSFNPWAPLLGECRRPEGGGGHHPTGCSRCMRLLGITGGVGMGKSTAEQMLRDRGVAVIDTDEVAHSLVEPGQEALEEIVEVFGREHMDGQGRLRRDSLAQLIFRDSGARRRLESILHPRIREEWLAQTAKWRAEGTALGAVVIPLLFETDAQVEFDATICVACCSSTQRQRLAERGWTSEQAEQRIAAQMPIEEKMAAADHVVWTEAGLDVHGAQWDRILGLVGVGSSSGDG